MATSLTTKVLNQIMLSENVCVTVVATYSELNNYERKNHVRHLGQLRHRVHKNTGPAYPEVVCDMAHHQQ